MINEIFTGFSLLSSAKEETTLPKALCFRCPEPLDTTLVLDTRSLDTLVAEPKLSSVETKLSPPPDRRTKKEKTEPLATFPSPLFFACPRLS